MTNNIPKIRFKDFSDEWKRYKLASLIIEYKETVDSNCLLPVLTSSKTEGVVLQETHFGRKQNHDITGYNILPRNYCTYRNRSDGIDFTFNINKCCDKGIISKFYPVFYGNKNNNITFISLVLNNSQDVAYEIGYTCTGTGQKVLSFLDLKKMKIFVPRKDEQDKITSLMDNLDKLITTNEQKLEKLKNIKTALLEKMFPQKGEITPKIRFKGFNGSWEKSILDNFGKATGGTSIETEFNKKGKYKVISIGSYSEDSTYNDQGIRVEKTDKTNCRILNKDDLTMILNDKTALGRIIGRVLLIDKDDSYVYNQRTERIEINIREFVPIFLYQLLNAPNIRKKIIEQSQGNTQIYVNWNTIKKTEYLVTKNKKEQERIGKFFNNIDKLISSTEKKIEKLRNIKSGLLEKMFV